MLVGIVGETGSGKSSGIMKLPSEETFIINVAGKELPWKGSMLQYNSKKGNYIETSDHAEITKWINTVSKLPKFKNLVIEDAQYIMAFEYMARANEKGYDMFKEIGAHFNEVLQAARSTRKDLNVFMLIHPDIEKDASGKVSVKMKTVGRMIDQYLTPEGLFTVVLYTTVKFHKDKPTEYLFVTNRQPDLPAKSPLGMFEELYIPNDLSLVSKAVSGYYN